MLKHETLTVRELVPGDIASLRRLLETSEYTYARFAEDELARMLATRPGVGTFSTPPGPLGRIGRGSLLGFLLASSVVPPSAWVGGFGVTWSQGAHFAEHLDLLLPAVERPLAALGTRMLYYSGSDTEADWLKPALEARGFQMVTLLRAYDKEGTEIPMEGNQRVRVRPFTAADVRGVLDVEHACFDQLWHYDAEGFLEVAATYPYFVVAEDERGIAGYQFNAVDFRGGYLVRIAVHPRAEGQGIGARLMAEAIRYFKREQAGRILLNTEERNHRAHRLYERFGFHLAPQRGFVLGRPIAPPVAAP
jgi:ribosomal protein S18 acetylase RimI-like enzyme